MLSDGSALTLSELTSDTLCTFNGTHAGVSVLAAFIPIPCPLSQLGSLSPYGSATHGQHRLPRQCRRHTGRFLGVWMPGECRSACPARESFRKGQLPKRTEVGSPARNISTSRTKIHTARP